MSTLKSLKLVKYTPATSQSANLTRRKKLVAKLEEQIRAVQDPEFQPVKLKWVRDEAGEDKRVEVRKRVREWWRVGESGTVTLTIRYGSKLIEFEPGKNAIELKSTTELVPVLEQVKRAVLSGELDQQLAAQAYYGKKQK
jgi:hypothetical protein